jgi:peptide/nickel transport system ATP-binding protein/oligopeptide transport system ATP-binding protein
MHSSNKLLEIRELKTYYYASYGVVKAVDGVSLELDEGENLGVAGESGSGKSTLGLSILRLVRPPGRIINGEILFKGEDILQKTEEEMRSIRGAKISIVFQDPTSSLNPVYTVGDQISEAISLHQYGVKGGIWDWFLSKLNRSRTREVDKKVEEVLDSTGISDVTNRRKSYPHQFSGGMRQRAMIAMAISCRPALLIADEPTTNLDVTIEAQIIDLLKELKKKFGLSILLITHNLGIISELCDKIAVMYAGNLMELSDTKTIFSSPKHPYTEALLKAVPRIGIRGKRLLTIPGDVPHLVNPPQGCKFHPRCTYIKHGLCDKKPPQLTELDTRTYVRCFRYAN